MPTVLLVIIIYVILNLAMLGLKMVRYVWKLFFSMFFNDGLADTWRDFQETIQDSERWWKKSIKVIVLIVCFVLLLAFFVVNLVVPILVYCSAYSRYKNPPKEKVVLPVEEWGKNIKPQFACVSLDTPILPKPYTDVIYVEDEYNPEVNEYIQAHYDEICRVFAKNCLSFNYFPKISGQPVSSASLQYMFPYLPKDFSFVNEEISMAEFRKHIVKGEINGPTLIYMVFWSKFIPGIPQPANCYYLYPDIEISLADQFEWYAERISSEYEREYSRHKVRGRLVDPTENADSSFKDYSPSNEDLMEEIRVRVEELRKRGVQYHLLRELFESKPTLSRMVITKDYRIFLPDYHNVEIVMPPLPKTMYLLFLRHPEGIVFKEMADYYEELLDIYKQITNRVVERNIKKSIRDLTDPTKNSINEKCSRIREAFMREFDEDYAKYYFITGHWGGLKKIMLPRDLVELQAL